MLCFHWQESTDCLDIFTDANWAGCRSARKSTSGGAIMLGKACLKTWSKTQGTIAQSSAESELLASVKGAAEGIGMVSLAHDLGILIRVRLHIDASVALGILERKGVGRVRHLDVGSLWLQEQQLRNIIEMCKVHGLRNPGDLMTKHLTAERIECYCEILGYCFPSGRSTTTADLHRCRPNSSGTKGGPFLGINPLLCRRRRRMMRKR